MKALTVLSVFSASATFATPYLWVSNYGSNMITVIDTTTNTQVGAPIQLPNSYGIQGLAFTPNGSQCYVGDYSNNEVYVINTATREVTTVTDSFSSFDEPYFLAATPDGTQVYVANYSGSTVSVIDTATNAVTSVVTSNSHGTIDGPFGIAASPTTSTVWVVNYATAGNIVLIDTASSPPAVIGTIPSMGTGPFYDVYGGIAFLPNGSAVYVASYDNSTVQVVEAVSPYTIDNIMSSDISYPSWVAFSPNGQLAYVSNFSSYLSVMNTSNPNDITPYINSAYYAYSIAISSDGSAIYLGNASSSPPTLTYANTSDLGNPHVLTGSTSPGASLYLNEPEYIAFQPSLSPTVQRAFARPNNRRP